MFEFELGGAVNFSNNSEYNNTRMNKAIQFADRVHAGQVRKSLDKEPFIVHCINVGNLLEKYNLPEDTVIAGVLHDTIEDTSVTKKNLIHNFGKNVAELVNHVTEQDKSKSWVERSRDYIEHLKVAPANALSISAADKIDNMNSITDSISRNYNIFQNMKGTPQMQLDKFSKIFEILKGKIPQGLLEAYNDSMTNFVVTLKLKKYL